MVGVFIFLFLQLTSPTSGNVCVDSQFRYRGQITRSTVTEYRHFVERCGVPKLIDIQSTGGDPNAAISIGNEIRKHNISVRVNGFCVSACALFFAIPAKRLLLDKGDIVGLHHSQTALKAIFEAVYPEANIDWDRLSRTSSNEIQFFSDNEIDDRWLTQPMAMIEPSCVFVGQWHRLLAPMYRSRYHIWAPPHTEFNNYTLDGKPNTARNTVRDQLNITSRSGEFWDGSAPISIKVCEQH